MTNNTALSGISLFSDFDINLFRSGHHYRLYEKFGSHRLTASGVEGTYFSVWAPNAESVSVVGNFNYWNADSHQLFNRWDESGIWEGFIPGLKNGELYKYMVKSNYNNYKAEKADPFAFHSELPPRTASIIWELNYEWKDYNWMESRRNNNALNKPISIYEIHLGSWRKVPDENSRSLSYREIADNLIEHVLNSGFTHVEFLPLMEHPFYGSWGYQICGFFAPTSRYGVPEDLMYLIDCLHQSGIGVIFDWVPSHFPTDLHGLGYFDGTHLYEHADPRKGFHPDWSSNIFNYERSEVKSFLISSAMYWLDKYHIDGLRVDGVASMLYLDYSRKEGEWIPNQYGGRENLGAISFLRELNESVYGEYPDTQVYAEESTAWPNVSSPTYLGGLGFGMKWNMGWMHDTLEYFCKDPVHRKYHQNDITFSILYAFSENFVLPLSHDEVVHGKGSLLRKMPGDDWQKFANLRCLYGYMWAHPGKKLLFMGGEFGQWDEWNYNESLDWHLLQFNYHNSLLKWLSDLNKFYKNSPALHEIDFSDDGFEWINADDYSNSVISFLRKDSKNNYVLVVCNYTPVTRFEYRIGVPEPGSWKEFLNSDSEVYGGSGQGNNGIIESSDIPYHHRTHSISLTLPLLSTIYLSKAD